MKPTKHEMSWEEARVVLTAMAKCETDPVKSQALTRGCEALAYRTARKPVTNEYDESCCWMCGSQVFGETICHTCGARIRYE